MFAYLTKIKSLIDTLSAGQSEQLREAAGLIAAVIARDAIVHTIGTGHSNLVAMEAFGRASSIANVNAILDDAVTLAGGARRSGEMERISGIAEVLWETYKIQKEDLLIVISNSGRNAIPIEMAIKARKEGLKVIAITSLAQSKKYPSRHKSGKKLYELADIVLDNCIPSGDGILKIGDILIGPGSSVLGLLIVNTLITEAIKISLEKGIEVPIFQSDNIDGADNEALYKRFESRVKHF